MPSRSRDRHLAKLAARRKAERDAAHRRRRITAGAVGAVIGVAAILIGLRIITQRNGAAASPSASASASGGLPTQTGSVTAQAKPPATVACGGNRPAAADVAKPQFDRAPDPSEVLKPDATYSAEIRTSCGTITVDLDTTTAPKTVASFVFLARHGFFDGTFFHRVVDSIDVIQGGDPLGTGTGGPGYPIPDELTGKEKYTPGTVAMANSGPDTGGSQFFIITGPEGSGLNANANYTIFGSVSEGLDVAKTINALMPKGAKSYDGAPTEAVYIEKITIHEKAKPKPSPSASVSASPSS
jgi:cyclophilin family peptidyl-prolyl cis-trans isomerase